MHCSFACLRRDCREVWRLPICLICSIAKHVRFRGAVFEGRFVKTGGTRWMAQTQRPAPSPPKDSILPGSCRESSSGNDVCAGALTLMFLLRVCSFREELLEPRRSLRSLTRGSEPSSRWLDRLINLAIPECPALRQGLSRQELMALVLEFCRTKAEQAGGVLGFTLQSFGLQHEARPRHIPLHLPSARWVLWRRSLRYWSCWRR